MKYWTITNVVLWIIVDISIKKLQLIKDTP